MHNLTFYVCFISASFKFFSLSPIIEGVLMFYGDSVLFSGTGQFNLDTWNKERKKRAILKKTKLLILIEAISH